MKRLLVNKTEFIYSDKTPNKGDRLVCVQKKNVNRGKIATCKNPDLEDLVNWKKLIATVEYVQQAEQKRNNSFWFDGQVALVTGNDGREISVDATGEIAVCFKPNEPIHNDQQARQIAIDRKYTDAKLNKLNNHDGWSNNNWFGFFDITNDLWLEPTSINFKEAVEIAVQFVNQKILEVLPK